MNDDITAKLELLTSSLKDNLSKKYSKLEESTKDGAVNTSAIPPPPPSVSAVEELEEFIDKLKDLFNEGLLEKDLDLSGNLTVNTVFANDIRLLGQNNLNVGRVMENAFGDNAGDEIELDIGSLIRGKDLGLSNQTISESLLSNCRLRGGTIEDVEFIGINLGGGTSVVAEEGGLIQTLGLMSNIDGILNCKLKPIGPNFPSGTPSSLNQSFNIVDVPTVMRFFYNDTQFESPKESTPYTSNSDIPITDTASLFEGKYKEDLFAIRCGIEKITDSTTGGFTTLTKSITRNELWDGYYPVTPNWGTSDPDQFLFTLQSKRISFCQRAAEFLYELPNDLPYTNGYSNFHINNLDVTIDKHLTVNNDSFFNANLIVKGSVNQSGEVVVIETDANDIETITIRNLQGLSNESVVISSNLGGISIKAGKNDDICRESDDQSCINRIISVLKE